MKVSGDFFEWFGQVAVLGVGWFVVHKLSVQRDRDKARRELVVKSVDGLGEAIDGLVQDAVGYHLSARDASLERKIKMTLQDLAMRAVALSDSCGSEAALAQCRSDIAALRRAITGQHFEDEHEGPVPDSSPQLQTIAECIMRAKRDLLRLKHQQFPR